VTSDRLVRWFYGVPNIVGLVLALVGLGLYLGHVVHGWLVPPIIIGLYLIGAVVTPRPRGIGGLAAASGGLDAGQMTNALAKMTAQARSRLPDELAAKVAAIQQTIVDLLPRMSASAIDPRDLFAVERTVSTYLPQTLDNYLTLPRVYAKTHQVSGGKTPEQLLGDQLDLIEQKMQEISDAVAKDDVGKLLTQGRFLEERFGRSDDLDLPAAAAEPASATAPTPDSPPTAPPATKPPKAPSKNAPS
jgi:hypothetical protein